MKDKRERLQIIFDILKAIQDGKIKPTHIMYRANLSHEMMNIYINDLSSKRFIIECNDKKGRTYNLTKKGFDYILRYKTIVDFIDTFGLE
jgi:predicted transcriptional regulator